MYYLFIYSSVYLFVYLFIYLFMYYCFSMFEIHPKSINIDILLLYAKYTSIICHYKPVALVVYSSLRGRSAVGPGGSPLPDTDGPHPLGFHLHVGGSGSSAEHGRRNGLRREEPSKFNMKPCSEFLEIG